MDARLAQEFFKLRSDIASVIKSAAQTDDFFDEAGEIADVLMVRFNINPIKES